MTTNLIQDKAHEPLANYLRTHRPKTGFTQHDGAGVLRLINRDVVSYHERQAKIPSLLIALSYEALYRVPVSEIFAGLAKTAEFNVETHLAEYIRPLHQVRVSKPTEVPRPS